MADIKIAGRIKAGAADGISGYASEILFDDQASNKTVKEKIEEVASSPQTMIVTISPDGNDGYEADKTFAEIAAFIDNGGTVIAKDEEDGDSYYYLDNYIASEVVFTRNIWGSGGFSTRYYTIDNTNAVSFIDSVHHISSAVNSSSTANLANSAAVKALRDSMSEIKSISVNNTEQQVDQEGNVDIAVPDSLAELSDDTTHRTVTDAEKATWNGKQNALTFDNVPTANSNNPVKSGGVYQAIQDIDVSSQISGKEDKSNKVTSFSSPTDTQYPSAKLVNDQLATKQGTISDLSTIRSGASAGATAYQKPGTGIPKTDLASAVQTSLGKADTAIQSVTVGTTTTGAAGSSASVTNTGTATEPVLSFTIPQGAQGIQGIQGPQGERGPQGNTGVQVDSVASIIHSIDPTATYAAADVAGADAVQDVLSEVTELAGNMGKFFRIALTNSNRLYYLGGTLGNQEWRESTNQYANQCYVVTGGHFYKLVANNTVGTTYAFIKSLPTAVGEVDFADNGKNISYPISAGEEKIFQVPDDCVYVTFLSLNRQPSAFYELIEIPTYKLIENETLVNATEGRTVCTHHVVPAGAILLYDFSITGGNSTSLACYLAIHKKDGTVTYIGKTSSASGNVEYANQYVLPVDYDYVSIEGITGGSMTVHKIHSTELVCGQIEKGIQAYNGMLFNKTLIFSPTRLAHNTVLFTSDTFKMGDCVHIDMTGVNDISGVVTLYDYNDNVISNYGKLTRNFTENNYTFDIEIPYNFAYAKVSATSLSDGEPYPQYLYINAIYKVAYEYGVFKIGNPLIETLESFNSKSENHIVTENAFGANDGLAKKRIPSVIVTNTGASIAVAQSKAAAGDDSPSGLIIGRKANGGSWTIDATTFQYNSSIGSLMNPTFVVDRTGMQGTQGRIYLFALAVTVTSSNGGYVYKCTTNEIAELYSYSDDDGVTWSSFAAIPKTAWDTSSYTWMCNSPSNGIITSDGTMALACMGRVGGANGVWVSGVMYKPVNGEWQFSQVSPRQGDNESVVFEGINGDIYLNCRNETFNYLRSLYKLNTTDGSLSTIYNGFNPKIALQCCIIKCTIDSDTCYLMTFPDPTVANQRNRITVWASVDGIRWARALRMTGDAISAGYAMISCYNGKCVMVWENDGWDCRTIGYADLTPSLELLKQSSLICGDNPDDKIHRVACYEKGISV